MNSLPCTISHIDSDSDLSIVVLELEDRTVFKSIIIDTEASSPKLRIGNKARVLFKETEVAIATTPSDTISLQNKIMGKISSIESGKLVSNLSIDTDAGQIISMISTAAVQRLDLSAGKQVYALIKLNELMLAL